MDFILNSLITKLKDTDPAIRKAGVQAIYRSPRADILPYVQNALIQEEHPKVLRWLALTLGEFGHSNSLKFLDARYSDIENDPDVRDWFDIGREMLTPRSDFTELIERIESSDTEIKRQALAISWACKSDRLAPFISNNLYHENPIIRRWAILSLTNLNGFSDSSLILDLLQDSDYLVREWTEWGLSKIKDPSTFEPLAERISDPHPRVREWAVKALAALNHHDIPLLLAAHYKIEPDEKCREGIIRSLQPYISNNKYVVDLLLSELEKSWDSPSIQLALIESLSINISGCSDEVIDSLVSVVLATASPLLMKSLIVPLIKSSTPHELETIRQVLQSKKQRAIVELLMNSPGEYTRIGDAKIKESFQYPTLFTSSGLSMDNFYKSEQTAQPISKQIINKRENMAFKPTIRDDTPSKEPGSISPKITILFLAANPSDTTRLRVDQEMRSIDQVLRQSEFRNEFNTKQQWAVRITDIQGYLLRHRPAIVHFSGHGYKSSGIVLEDDDGKSRPVAVHALSRLFSILKDDIKCVVLNACYSDEQAQAIAEHINCVVGMSEAIGDSAAISFATAFYQALGYGRDVKTAFDLGCVQIDLENLRDKDVPKLLSLKVDPSDIVLIHN